MQRAVAASPDELRARALDRLCVLTGSSAATWFRFGMVEGMPLPTHWLVRGVDEIFVRRRLEERIEWADADPRMPDPRWDRRFVVERSLIRRPEHAARAHERCYAPAEVHDVARMIVIDQGRFLAWVGVLRRTGEAPFGTRELRQLRAAADEIADTMIWAERAERSSPLCGGAVVLDRDGTLELASAGGVEASSSARRSLASAARALLCGRRAPSVVAGHHVRWCRLAPPDGEGPDRALAVLHPAETLRVHPAYVLSTTERAVASCAAMGATVDEIARSLGMGRPTVRTHLRHTYEKLGLSTRAELARELEGAPLP